MNDQQEKSLMNKFLIFYTLILRIKSQEDSKINSLRLPIQYFSLAAEFKVEGDKL